jgi:hypothetical protein
VSESSPAIVDVRTHVLLDPGFDLEATSSAQDTIVVEVETEDGCFRPRSIVRVIAARERLL